MEYITNTNKIKYLLFCPSLNNLNTEKVNYLLFSIMQYSLPTIYKQTCCYNLFMVPAGQEQGLWVTERHSKTAVGKQQVRE